jgi:hypothetical protein
MGCEVCCGYAGGLRPNPSGCPCCGPEREEREECRGGDDGCWGCDECERETYTSRTVVARAPRSERGVARRARNGIRPGDTIRVTKGFKYQLGGPRGDYYMQEQLLERGSAWTEDEREQFRLGTELDKKSWGWTPDQVRGWLDTVTAFEARTGLKVPMWRRDRFRSRWRNLDQVRNYLANEDRKAREAAEWALVAEADAGAEVMFNGASYVKGTPYTTYAYAGWRGEGTAHTVFDLQPCAVDGRVLARCQAKIVPYVPRI